MDIDFIRRGACRSCAPGVGLLAVLVVLTSMTPEHALGQPEPSATTDVETLIRGLESSSATERAMAACSLGRMRADDIRRGRDALLALLTDGTDVRGRLCRDEDNRWNFGGGWEESSPGREAAIALEELGTEVLDPLIALLAGPDVAGRENAAFALGLIESPAAVPALTRALGDEDEAVRGQAAWALGMTESAAAVPALTEALGDENAAVREQAAWALGMTESETAVASLVPAIQDSSPDVREQVAWALGMIEDASAAAALVDALDDEDPDVREQAAWALGMIESPSGVEGLVRALRADPVAGVREQAAWALGMIEDRSAAEALVEALDDEDPDVRDQAMWALGMVMGSSGFETIDRAELAEAVRRALRRDP